MRDVFRSLLFSKPPAVSVIVPTFGEAPFARWAIAGIRAQTLSNLEILVVCDGSPPGMLSVFKNLSRDDRRIKIFSFAKSARTGEPYRDRVIRKKARGKHIFYCSHDDLWLPGHVHELALLLENDRFVHSLHASPIMNRLVPAGDEFFSGIHYADLRDPSFREKMLDRQVPRNYFGLTFCAHTREAYLQLAEGWATTPEGVWTDLHMWRKFLVAHGSRSATLKKVTALSFPASARAGWSAEQRTDELAHYFQLAQEPGFSQRINGIASQIVPELHCAGGS